MRRIHKSMLCLLLISEMSVVLFQEHKSTVTFIGLHIMKTSITVLQEYEYAHAHTDA